MDRSTGKCKCQNYLSNIEGTKCSTCSDAIPGCNECEQTDAPGESLHIDLGIPYDSDLTDKRGRYLKCAECGKGMFKEPESKECRFCNQIFKGCSECAADGSECEKCDDRFYMYQDRDGKNKCSHCTRWGASCQECDLQKGCLDCGEGYYMIGGSCFKRLFSW